MKNSEKRTKQLSRMFEILGMINSGKQCTRGGLAEYFEVSERTISRDLSLISKLFPVYYDTETGCYSFAGDYSFKDVNLSPEEVRALLMCRLIASNLGESVSGPIDSLMKKLKVEMGKKSSKMLERASASYAFDMEKEADEVSANQRRLKVVQHALERKQSLKITHNDQNKSARMIDPYALHFRKGMWHVVAHDHRDDEIIYFALNRIRDIEETAQSSTIPVNFSLDDFVKTNPDKVYKEDLYELQQMLGWLDSYMTVRQLSIMVGVYYDHWKKTYQKYDNQAKEIKSAINDRKAAISKFEQMKRKGEGIDEDTYLKLRDQNKADEIKLKEVTKVRSQLWALCGEGKTKEEMENLLKEEEERMNELKASEEFKESVSRLEVSERKVKREEIFREIEDLKRRIAKGGD